MAIRHPITDHACLRTAEIALATHRATRPATIAEADKIASDYRAQERAMLDQAAALRTLRGRTTAERIDACGRGAACIEAQHEDGRMVVRSMQEASRIERRAYAQRMYAEAWERIAAQAEGAAWRETLAELAARRDYYAARCGG